MYRVKLTSAGDVDRFKARLVAKVYHQQDGLDYNETFSPVVKSSTMRAIFNIVITMKWCIKQLDVSNAFLHGELSEQVFMEQPQDFVDFSRPNHVCCLHKALYGVLE